MDKNRSKQINVFAVTWLSYAALYLTRKNFGVIKSDLHQDLGLTVTALGSIETCFLVVYAVGQFISGWLGDRVGAKRVIAAGLMGSAIFSFAFAFTNQAIFFALLFALNGLFQSTGWSNNIKAIEPWFDKTARGKVLSLWGTNQQAGGLLGTVLAAFLLARFGWQSAFIVPSIIVLVVGVLTIGWLVEPKVVATTAVETTESVEKDERPNYRMMLKNPVLWSLSIAYFGLKMIRYSMLFWLPFYLHETLLIPTDQAGYLSVLFEIGGIVGAIAIGFISDRYFSLSRGKLMMPLFMMLAAALYLYREYASTSILVNCLLIAVIGFFVFGPDSFISGACAQDIGGKHMTGSAAGFINGVGSLGAMFQGLITAYVSETWGWSSLFHFFMVMAVLSGLMLLPFWLKKEGTTKNVPILSGN